MTAERAAERAAGSGSLPSGPGSGQTGEVGSYLGCCVRISSSLCTRSSEQRAENSHSWRTPSWVSDFLLPRNSQHPCRTPGDPGQRMTHRWTSVLSFSLNKFAQEVTHGRQVSGTGVPASPPGQQASHLLGAELSSVGHPLPVPEQHPRTTRSVTHLTSLRRIFKT